MRSIDIETLFVCAYAVTGNHVHCVALRFASDIRYHDSTHRGGVHRRKGVDMKLERARRREKERGRTELEEVNSRLGWLGR